MINQEAYYENYDRYVKHLLSRARNTISLALLSDDPDIALGWSMNEGEVLHYVYTCGDQRGQGVARELFKLNPFHTITHMTKDFEKLLSKKKNIKFNPFL